MRARGDKERSWWSTAATPLPSQKARAGEWPKAKVASGQGGREGNRCLEPKWLRTDYSFNEKHKFKHIIKTWNIMSFSDEPTR